MKNGVIIGIHPDKIGEESYSNKWIEFLLAHGVKTNILDLLAPDAMEQVSKCDGIMWRWAHTPSHKQSAKVILYSIEHYLKIPVYPDTPTSWHYDEKVAQYYLFKSLDIQIPNSWVFWDHKQALKWAETTKYPVVWKLSSGAGSSNVLKVKNKKEAFNLINRAFTKGIFPYTMNEFKSGGMPTSPKEVEGMLGRLSKAIPYTWNKEYPPLHPVWWKPEYGYAYFQEFLPANAFDTRVTIIGNRAFGFRRINRQNDFRASGSGNIDFDPSLIDHKCIDIAFKISKKGKFQSMAYDFLYKNGKPVVCEISYTFADWAVYECPGHWDSNLNWIEGHMWPEEAQIEDFLQKAQDYKEKKLE